VSRIFQKKNFSFYFNIGREIPFFDPSATVLNLRRSARSQVHILFMT